MLRTYSELITLPTFEERLKYLRCGGTVGEYTFSFERYLNQNFYRTNLWRKIRRTVILRDNNCDLAMPDPSYDVGNYAIVHHMNPIGKQDIIDKSDMFTDVPQAHSRCSGKIS